ncbi:adenylate/guanylate cyclase domain-containing protein [Hoyosella sp. G463]|uniref:Adenylate/guanylate cyclase domain-containing protein n=1 Tax=Lolliginicoccus lacisalsi TaxID=2742202 RepID=A0A927PM48_9ACTN|nr:adenylate/guanylate cyclase domain-containing protein [Lolliginicoccus lacisalsi]MBD8506062.1 adenylate/guanylate cyclase domain-containing protein [Lolliginicoccus lacisalsi]
MSSDTLVMIAAAEAVIILVLALLLVRSTRQVAKLRHELRTQVARRLFAGSRDAVKTVWHTANLVRTKGIGAAVRSSVEDLAGWAQVERPDLARMTVDGRVVILFSDIEGSTTLNEQLGDQAWVRLLAKHDRLIRQAVARHHGYVIKSQGDGFMVAFKSPDDAVLCAASIQEQLARVGWASRGGVRVRVRIGIHSGRSVRRGDDLFGRNVAMAARVASQAEGGETLISESVRKRLDPTVPIVVEGHREAELKGFEGTHVLHLVRSG